MLQRRPEPAVVVHAPPAAPAPVSRAGSRHAGIFLLSCATLLLELGLTRVLSVSLWYHFGFLVISTALLGFGAAGVLLALWPWLRERAPLAPALALLSLGFGAVTVASFWGLQRVPFDPFALLVDGRQWAFMPLYYVTIAAPFFCAGLAVALLLTRGGADVNRLYAFDLAGAALGCAAIAWVIPRVGGSGTVVVAAGVGFAAAAAFASGGRGPRTGALALAGLTLALVAGVFAPRAEALLPVAVTPNKGWPPRVPILATGWNTFSRVDLVEAPADPKTGAPSSRIFIIDSGTASTGIDDLRPDVQRALQAHPPEPDPAAADLAFLGKRGARVLVIGSGAGNEVVQGLRAGASSITAVEINPLITAMQTGPRADFWGGLFDQPQVHLVTDEGRSFVRRSTEHYDAILSHHTISNAAVASGALSLAENYVLTLEAFEDYLDHLAPDGTLFFTRPEAQLGRLLATARELFERRGLGSPAQHLVLWRIVGDARLPPGAPAFVAGFLLKRSPFTPEELKAIEARATLAAPDGTRGELLYAPDHVQPGSLYQRLLEAPDVRAVYAAEPAQLAPATDDRPFFNQRSRWSSLGPSTLKDLFAQKRGDRLARRLALENKPVAELTLAALLVQACVVAAVLILLPLVRWQRAGLRVAGRGALLVYFAGLGLGFIMVEIALLQRFTLFLGQPVYTLAVVLASLLAFTGVGSALAERALVRSGGDPLRTLRTAIPVLLALLLLTALATPLVFRAALGLDLPWRVVLSALMVAPLGIALGVPFPTGLREVAARAPELIPWAWGVNGFFTVIGSVAALMLGMGLGFRVVLGLAAACYGGALLALASGRTKAPSGAGTAVERGV
ncbi:MULTISPECIES: spermidine synthase [Myxococcaceae]|uniref:spermidine synthase n=1 Tax=Myxococcaceae TaxID=31 RepID=UPI00129C3C3F|nr:MULTISPECIES: hypothetical protein [Myxococcaceae]MBF5040979.1 hypothetical protein [Simulacricoccus sp. 17bor-14]